MSVAFDGHYNYTIKNGNIKYFFTNILYKLKCIFKCNQLYIFFFQKNNQSIMVNVAIPLSLENNIKQIGILI